MKKKKKKRPFKSTTYTKIQKKPNYMGNSVIKHETP